VIGGEESKLKMNYAVSHGDRATKIVKLTLEDDKPDDDSGTPTTMLSFESQCLKVMPSISTSMSSVLVDLNLSRNELSELPDEIGDFVALEHLNISRNAIRLLPRTLGNLRQLVSLNALSNSLRPHQRSLPLRELASLPCLELLDLRFNEKLKGPALEALTETFTDHVVDIKVTIRTPKQQQQQRRDGAHEDGHNTSTAPEVSMVVLHACDRDATLLQSQLEPWSTPHLRKRLEQVFGQPPTDPETVHREEIMERLLVQYNKYNSSTGPTAQRPIQWFQGRPVKDSLCKALLTELRDWAIRYGSCPRERPTIKAQVYMILRSPEEFSKKDGPKARLAGLKLQQNQKLWELAHEAMMQTDPVFAEQYTALAVTSNFTGSPHIDTQNIGPFYGLSLGDFTKGGGALCVELDPVTVAAVDTRNRLGKVDGRNPHWVAPYKGERFSLIYYQTLGVPLPMSSAVFSEPCMDPYK
jgi:hypothetical protein